VGCWATLTAHHELSAIKNDSRHRSPQCRPSAPGSLSTKPQKQIPVRKLIIWQEDSLQGLHRQNRSTAVTCVRDEEKRPTKDKEKGTLRQFRQSGYSLRNYRRGWLVAFESSSGSWKFQFSSKSIKCVVSKIRFPTMIWPLIYICSSLYRLLPNSRD